MTAITSLTAICLAVLAVASLADAGSWSKWYDRDNPSATGDWELRTLMKPVPCGGKTPRYIEVAQRRFFFWRTILRTDNYIHAGPKYGLVCINKENTWTGKPYPQCRDFVTRYTRKILFWQTSSWYDRDQPSATGDWELAKLQSAFWASKGKLIEFKTKPSTSIKTYGKYLDRKIHVGAKYGLRCVNAENKKLGLPSCRDYRVRFYCV